MDILLNVRPEVLLAKSGELITERSTITELTEQAKSEINSLTGVWKSEASDEYQGRFKQIYDDIENVLAIVSEYIVDLDDAARIYTAAESAAKAAAEGLPIDGVFRN